MPDVKDLLAFFGVVLGRGRSGALGCDASSILA